MKTWFPEQVSPGAEAFGPYWIEKSETTAGVPYVKVIRQSTGKLMHFYRFRDDTGRQLWIDNFKHAQQQRAEKIAKTAEKKRAARAGFVNPHKVGDIFYTSWGYEQTNVDWFQAVAVGPRSVTLQAIAEDREYTGDMNGTTTPRAGEFLENSKPFRVVIQISESGHYLPARHGSYYPWNGNTKHWSSYH